MAMTWGLALATYRRPDMLLRCIQHAARQTRPASEIVVVDSSDDWMDSRSAVEDFLRQKSQWPGTLTYLPAERRGACSQRNQAIAACNADVLFILDDDSLMYPDAAAQILQLYEQDATQTIAAVQPRLATRPPESEEAPQAGGSAGFLHSFAAAVNRWLKGPFFPAHGQQPDYDLTMFGDSVHRIEQLHGARMTARREAIQRCRFDEAIVINYHDDSEISWRLASVGALVELDAPLIFHAEAARPADGSRRDFRTRAAWVLNHAYLCRKLFGDSAETERAIRRYARGTAILDLFTGLARRDLSSFRGSNHARRRLPALLRASRETMASVLIAESEKL